MSSQSVVRLAWIQVGFAVILWLLTVFLHLLAGMPATDPGRPSGAIELAYVALRATTFLGMVALGGLIAARHPGNAIGWLYSSLGNVAAFVITANRYTQYVALGGPALLLGDGAVLAWLGNWLNAGSGALLVAMILLFPDGRLASRRWTGVLWSSVAFSALSALAVALAPGPLANTPWIDNPVGLDTAASALTLVLTVGTVGSGLTLLLAAACVAVRLRRATGEERQQLRWVAYGGGLWILTLVLSLVVALVRAPDWLLAVQITYVIAFAVAVVCAGVGVLKYRLYDVDRLIVRTLEYGLLAVVVGAIYVALVVGVGAIVGAGDRPNIALSLLATAAVAVLFQPLRERLQHLAERLAYGQRATPYEVLAEFSRRVSASLSIDEVLPRMAETAAKGVGAARSRVRVYVAEDQDWAFAWPPEAVNLVFDHVVPVLHQGEVVGELSISKPPGEPLTPAESVLLADLAAQAGPAVANARLAVALRAQAEELRGSRQRIVSAQDAERRRLERDIHDGAQQQLVALAVNVRVAQELIESDPAEANGLLAEVGEQLGEALETLRNLARGIFPAVLADRGLVSALEAQLVRGSARAHLLADSGVRDVRFDLRCEAAAYFCCLEALQNCAKHASGAPVQVHLALEDAWLAFKVSDSGPGFDVAVARDGTGLQGMADRLAAIGGTLEVRSQLGQGTVVSGRVPAASSTLRSELFTAEAPDQTMEVRTQVTHPVPG